MAYFGKYTVMMDVTHPLKLEPDWWWKFKPTSSADELGLIRWVEEHRKTVVIDGRPMLVPPEWIEIAWRELAVSFAGTNIPLSDIPVEQGGLPIVNADDSVEGREEAIKLLPLEMVKELWTALGESNPLLGPRLTEPSKPADGEEENPSGGETPMTS